MPCNLLSSRSHKSAIIIEICYYFGTRNIVEGCRSVGAKLVYTSTVYVFDGKKGDYQETDACNPLNVYGRTKLEGEREVLTLDDTLILRFDILYGYNGPQGPNSFFGKVMQGGVEVNCDQVRQPLLVDDLGRAIKTLLAGNHTGVYHLAGPQRMVKYDLGCALEKLVRSESTLVPVPEKEMLARHPRNVTLNMRKAIDASVRFSSLEEGLESIRTKLRAA